MQASGNTQADVGVSSEVDAIAAAVTSCPSVAGLDAGPVGSAATYLPGRRVAGVAVGDDAVTVQVAMRWAATAVQVNDQLRSALQSLLKGRILNVVISDVAAPGTTDAPEESSTPTAALPAARSSAPTTPTAAGTPNVSVPASTRSIHPG